MNEPNTRSALIDPMLDVLGWDTRDPNVVDREVPVHDGTTVDYALIGVDGTAVLYVEAKALGVSLTDPKVVSQTVNYANNAGVPWCVLTDGLRWRVFWTIAPVAMDRKNVFDVDLSTLDEEAATAAERTDILLHLALLSREAVEAGDLDDRGRLLFDNAAVTIALDRLFSNPPDELADLVATRLDHPIDLDRVRNAVARLGRPFQDSPTEATGTELPSPKVVADSNPGKYARVPHTYDEHFGKASAAMVDLYQRFHEAVMSRGDRIERTFRAYAVNYAIDGKHIFVTVVPRASRLLLYLVLPGERADGNADLRNMRPDGTEIGHHGYGDVEAVLTPENFVDRLSLVDEALAARAAAGYPASST